MTRPIFSPLSLSGSDVGCLLIHGFTSCPLDVRPLTKHLHKYGFTARELLLPGHGTSYEDMAQYGWRDWLEAVEAELNVLKRECPQVWLAGFSMGGILAALAASRHTLQGMICISAPIWPWPKRTRLAWALQYFQKYAQLGRPSDFKFPSWRYEQVAVKNIADMMHLIRIAKPALAGIEIPVLVVQGTADRTIEARSAQYIYNKLGSLDKELLLVQDGGHMLLLESRHDEAFARIGQFISCRTGGKRDV